MMEENISAQKTSSPLRGEVGANAPGWGAKPFSKQTQQNASRLRNQLTEAEKKIWYYLRNKQMDVKFRRQQPIGIYIVDFISFEASLIIEIDGGQHNTQQSYDEMRDAFLKNEGFMVLRFWNNEVLNNIDGVRQKVSEYLQHPLPTSPFKGEELIEERV